MSGLWCLREETIGGQNQEVIKRGLKIYLWDFPGGPVVKTLPFNTAECEFDPWSGSSDPAWLTAKNPKRKPDTEL